jgi:hypothetical protein
MIFYIMLPVFSFSTIGGGDLVGVNITSSPVDTSKMIFALEVAALVFLVVLILGRNIYFQKLAMLGPFGIATVFFGVYIYYYFASSFTYYSTVLISLLAAGSFALVPVLLVIFAFTILFFVTGFFSFLYEVWRD